MVVQYFHKQGREHSEVASLTQRETEIVELLARGHRYKEIAATLDISFDTVRSHLRNIYEKLHVSSRTEAVVKYLSR
jgi:DNA-binding NarL/FixJ family response regulator